MLHLEAIIERNENPAPQPTTDESYQYASDTMVALKAARHGGEYNSPSHERPIDAAFMAQWAEADSYSVPAWTPDPTLETGPGLERERV